MGRSRDGSGGTNPGEVGRLPGEARALNQGEDTDYTKCTTLGRVELDMVGLPWKALTRDAMRLLGSLPMQPVGCIPWCSTEALVDVAPLLMAENSGDTLYILLA